jgi:hypothetical protein
MKDLNHNTVDCQNAVFDRVLKRATQKDWMRRLATRLSPHQAFDMMCNYDRWHKTVALHLSRRLNRVNSNIYHPREICDCTSIKNRQLFKIREPSASTRNSTNPNNTFVRKLIEDERHGQRRSNF